MDRANFNTCISFTYAGKPFAEYTPKVMETEAEGVLTRVLTFGDGLKVTTAIKKVNGFDAWDWVSYFENTGDEDTSLIADIKDADIALPLPHADRVPRTAYIEPDEAYTMVRSQKGSIFASEFSSDEHYGESERLNVGKSLRFATSGGRSSQQKSPFFHASYKGEHYVFAIGWTGQWECEIARESDFLSVKTGLEKPSFVLHPGEKIRTSSFVVLHGTGDFWDVQNTWRRMIKLRYSLIGSDGRAACAPYSVGLWGGMSTAGAVARINAMADNHIPFDYVWMDAGWYGTWGGESPDEVVGEWSGYTGDWRVNPCPHPDGLLDYAAAVKGAGMKLLLWFEPEHITEKAPIYHDHPEYILGGTLLNLGNEEAWQYCFDTISRCIRRLQIDCYRHDFNMNPLSFWVENDAPDRQGITEIKHIMGLYRLWDTLLEHFPHLIIDNCSSGGRRIDIETLRRSVPLWRSDRQCYANYDPGVSQTHSINYGTWFPYSGTGSGRIWGDTYRFRSAYAPGLMTQLMWSERDPICDDPALYAWLRKMSEEYLRVRPYLSADIYPLSMFSDMKDTWCAVQYHAPSEDAGILQVFRREESAYTQAVYQLHGLITRKTYTITDADTGESITADGAELMGEGFCVNIKETRTAKLYYIR